MTSSVDELVRQAAEHQAAADAAEAQLAAHRAEEEATRAARGQAWDRGLLAEFRERMQVLEAEQREAQAAFRAAVITDPLIVSWIELRATRWKRDALATSARSAAARLGEENKHRIPTVEFRSPRLLEDLVELADNEAQARGSDLAAEVEGDRNRHVAGDES